MTEDKPVQHEDGRWGVFVPMDFLVPLWHRHFDHCGVRLKRPEMLHSVHPDGYPSRPINFKAYYGEIRDYLLRREFDPDQPCEFVPLDTHYGYGVFRLNPAPSLTSEGTVAFNESR